MLLIISRLVIFVSCWYSTTYGGGHVSAWYSTTYVGRPAVAGTVPIIAWKTDDFQSWRLVACPLTSRVLPALCGSGLRIAQTCDPRCQCFSPASSHTAQAHAAKVFSSVAFADRFYSSKKTAKAVNKLVPRFSCALLLAGLSHKQQHTCRFCLHPLLRQEWWLQQFHL